MKILLSYAPKEQWLVTFMTTFVHRLYPDVKMVKSGTHIRLTVDATRNFIKEDTHV